MGLIPFFSGLLHMDVLGPSQIDEEFDAMRTKKRSSLRITIQMDSLAFKGMLRMALLGVLYID